MAKSLSCFLVYFRGEMSHKQRTIRSYEDTAEAYAEKVKDLAPVPSIDRFVALLPPKARILDLGCGSGRDAKLFTDRGLAVLGADLSSNLIAIAKGTAPKAEFQIMDMENLDLPPSSFDGVWAACSLHHAPKRLFPSVLDRIRSILKKEGLFYLTLKMGSGEALEKDTRYGDFDKFWAYYEEAELENLVRAAGFKILETTLIQKSFAYQTHPCIRIFCRKE